MDHLFWYIVLGTLAGSVVRVSFLEADYRRYPTTPNGLLIQVTVGTIASAMGAVTVPALAAKNYVAVTFLALAIQQLRQVRSSERDSLQDLEASEFIPRGSAYIDEIAKSFEARNYLALIVGLLTSGTATLIDPLLQSPVLTGGISLIIGGLVGWALRRYSNVRTIGDVATVRPAPILVKGYDLYVGDIYVMNIGLEATRQRIQKEGFGIIIEPRNIDGKISIANAGQRRAITSDVGRVLGTQRYLRMRRDFETEQVALLVVPIRGDQNLLMETVRETPLLEVVRRAHA